MLIHGHAPEIQTHADERMLDALSRHRCVGCGACCRWPGQVYLYSDDIDRLSNTLGIDRATFLTRYCTILHWPWAGSEQFRIALARKPSGECMFLEGAVCTVHKFKPLMCKAGPAAWPFINNARAFWFYVKNSPSFQHPAGTMSLVEANEAYLDTRKEESIVGSVHSLSSLAGTLGLAEAVLQRLPLVQFKGEEGV